MRKKEKIKIEMRRNCAKNGSKNRKPANNKSIESVDDKDKNLERRKEQRIPIEIEVKYSTGDSFVIDWTMNISRGGMFIRTPNPLPVGSVLKIQFSVPGAQENISAEGIVRWKIDPSDPNIIPGMGIEIISIDESSKNILNEFIKKNLKQK